MGSLNTALTGAASALDAFQYALNVSQNNIDNASTPGYAKQTASLEADPFNPALGLTGGVSQGPTVDSRDPMAEADVWQQSSAQGAATAQSDALTDLQNALPTSDGDGIPGALTNFFTAVSAWSASPSDSSTAQSVIDAAGSLAQSFNTTAAAVGSVAQSVSQSIGDTVSQINGLTGQLASLNASVENGGQQDAGVSAQIYSSLETLSGLVNIQVLPQTNGAVEVTLAGGAPLVIGTQQFQISSSPVAAAASPPIDTSAPAHAAIYAADGTDVTGQIASGTLAGQLQVLNVAIPAVIGDSAQPGALNELATQVAADVNGIVGAGYVSAGVPATGGLFVPTDPNHPDSAAANLALNAGMTASGLPAIGIENGSSVPNGVPLALGALASTPTANSLLGDNSYTAYYGNAAAEVGSQLNQQQSNQSLATQSLAQAQSMRQTDEGVDLNTEAVNVMQLQESYQAVAKVVNTLETLTQALINMMPTS